MLPVFHNSTSGVNKYELVGINSFQVTFTLPEKLQNEFGTDVAILTEQLQKISGLNTLDKGPDAVEQQFMGTTRTYLKNKLDKTSHELKITLALNLRNATDNFVYKLFKAWNHLGYNIEDGTTSLKKDYCADFLKVQIANNNRDIYREIVYKDVMLKGGLNGPDELDYSNTDAAQIEVTLVSDWALETNL